MPVVCPAGYRTPAEPYVVDGSRPISNFRTGSARGGQVTRYGGPFLDGEFEPSAIASARERFHAAFLRVVRDMAAHRRRHEVPGRAIELYRWGLEVDEVAVEFHHGVLRCCLTTGRIAEGIAAYRRCRAIVGTTVNVQPSAETERLHQELPAAQAAASASAPAGAPLSAQVSSVSPGTVSGVAASEAAGPPAR